MKKMTEIRNNQNQNINQINKTNRDKEKTKTWVGISLGVIFIGLSAFCPGLASDIIGATQTFGALSKVTSQLTENEELGDFADVINTGSSMGSGANFMSKKFNTNHIKNCNNCVNLNGK